MEQENYKLAWGKTKAAEL